MKDFRQYEYGADDDVDMSSNNESDTEDESESDAEDLDLLEIINDIESTFNYSLQLRKTRLGLKCQTPVKVKVFALASLDSLKFRSSVFSLQRSSFMKFILGMKKI